MDDIRLTADLRRDGFSADDIARGCRDGRLSRVRRGAYAASTPVEARPEDLHLRLVMATLPQLHRGAVLSYESAAVIHGLPAWSRGLDRIHITRPRVGGGVERGIVVIHSSDLFEEDVVEVHGLRVTSLARTVADLGRTRSIDQAVAAGDRALTLGLERQALDAVVAAQRGWPGVPRARQVAQLIDARAESPGESVSRVRCWEAGLPAPTLQYVVRCGGAQIGRCDFAWEQLGTIGEFDGRVKYGRLLRADESIQDVVYREKQREDALRDLGWQVVRWTWSDLYEPGTVANRLRRAFRRGRLVAL